MFPLKQRTLIRGAAAHVKAGLGIAADYVAINIPFVIPFDGRVETYWGTEGGNWLRLIRPNGDRIELAHLSKYAIKNGPAKAGQAGGVTGNTGAITTGPHLHIQIFNKAGKRLDPETYNWEKGNMGQLKTANIKGEEGIFIPASTPEEFKLLCAKFGKDPAQIDITV
jgi:murein DD-endopeptidase MepM/ murein hydrolase activator NlpD